MVKAASPGSQKGALRWWRGFLGALLTCLIVVPYMMGADVEKYLRGWMDAVNQRKGSFQLELLNYQRHWFSSDGDLTIAGGPLPEKITVHFKAYHGPVLIFNDGRRLRLGLSYLTGTIDSKAVLGQQTLIKMDGPIELMALVPYFSDRELHATFPPLTLTDKGNGLIYYFNTVEGKLDGDGLLQLELPAIKVSRFNGNALLDMDSALLRLQSGSRLASLSVKQINLHLDQNSQANISNFLLQANTETLTPPADTLKLQLTLHFDQFKQTLKQNADLLELGPFEFKLGIKGLRYTGLVSLANTIQTISTQSQDLTPEQGETLEKGLSNLFSPTALFDLSSSLNTAQGKINAQFQGGFTPSNKTQWETAAELVDAFYTKGSLQLDPGVKQALSDYAANQKPLPQNPEDLPQTDFSKMDALPTLLGFFKQKGPSYTANVDIRAGRISLNGKDIKSNP